VAGLEDLPPVIKDPFLAHVSKTFGVKGVAANNPNPVIQAIFSIGSIGTVGHKHLASDLDLQILYRLEPFLVPKEELTTEAVKGMVAATLKSLFKQLQRQNKVSVEQLTQNPNLAGKINEMARRKFAQGFPLLNLQFIKKELDLMEHLRAKPNPKVKNQLIQEIEKLHRMATKSMRKAELSLSQERLKAKITKVQDYVAKRYPTAEIYLFPMSDEDMKNGKFSSTLESKESSGSAYELILTYDTLMPGVYFTPLAPAHFLFDGKTNNEKGYHQLVEGMRFGLFDPIFGSLKTKVCEQGPTPDLTEEYIGGHNGAIYWEAFKASSGNLPKALMNLMRYETLLYPKTRRTMIQVIKDPSYLNGLVDRMPTGTWTETFLPRSILAIESSFPNLAFDPWWARYKALKIAYCESLVPRIEDTEGQEISDVLDLAFALHVRISDVFDRPGVAQKFESHREKVLREFLSMAFPPNSKKRIRVEGIFIGDTNQVTLFEQQMRKLFKKCINRIAMRLDQMQIKDEKEINQEFQIWYHYYKKNFEPLPNVVQPTILQHLKVPRGRVLVGFEKGQLLGNGWFFKAFQKNTVRGFGQNQLLAHLPEETLLIENCGFLKGLAHCIFNGYYGKLNQGTLKETFTSLELLGTHIDLGSESDNDYAYLQPGQIEALTHQILSLFPHQKIDYRACLQEDLRVTELLICLNLWHCGQLSFLYRNSLGNVTVDELEVPKFFAKAKQYHELNRYQEVLSDSTLFKELSAFLEGKKVDLGKIRFGVWLNHNSFETSHPLTNVARKEADLNREFRAKILERHYQPPTGAAKVAYEAPEPLKRVVLCGALVAAIDGEVNKKEYGATRELLSEHWNPKWGDQEIAFTGVLEELKRLLSAGNLLNRNLNLMAEGLKFELTLDQQLQTVKLMERMLAFDSKNQQNKQTLIQTFKKAIDLPEPYYRF